MKMKKKTIGIVIGIAIIIIGVGGFLGYRNNEVKKYNSKINEQFQKMNDLKGEAYFQAKHSEELDNLQQKYDKVQNSNKLSDLKELSNEVNVLVENTTKEIDSYNKYYKLLKEEIETSDKLLRNYFSREYDLSKINETKTNASNAIDSSDFTNYEEIYSSLASQDKALNQYIEDEMNKIYNVPTELSEQYPFGVDAAEMSTDWSYEPLVKQNKNFPTYEQLPKELKEIFNGYQMEVVIYQNCDTTKISKLVRKLNNCKPMNQAQRAFTYIDAFAREIREIADNRFFKDMYSCNNKDRINGTFERAIGDMVILCEYPSQYRKDTKVGFKWLNENATILDFENLNDLLIRLTESTEITSEIRGLFNRKNGYIFVATFKAFTELGREDKEFGEFLHWLITEGKDTEINGKTWTELDIDRSTRDSGTVHGKFDYLTALVKQYFTEVKNVA